MERALELGSLRSQVLSLAVRHPKIVSSLFSICCSKSMVSHIANMADSANGENSSSSTAHVEFRRDELPATEGPSAHAFPSLGKVGKFFSESDHQIDSPTSLVPQVPKGMRIKKCGLCKHDIGLFGQLQKATRSLQLSSIATKSS